jgi:chemotaxis protein CheY-P-specific phosphatase CheC
MHAVVVQVNINDFERGREFLTSQVVPRVSQAPGFVAGYWARMEDDKGRSLIVFESEEAAQTAKQMIESNAPNDDAVTLESAEVGEVVASA